MDTDVYIAFAEWLSIHKLPLKASVARFVYTYHYERGIVDLYAFQVLLPLCLLHGRSIWTRAYDCTACCLPFAIQNAFYMLAMDRRHRQILIARHKYACALEREIERPANTQHSYQSNVPAWKVCTVLWSLKFSNITLCFGSNINTYIVYML